MHKHGSLLLELALGDTKNIIFLEVSNPKKNNRENDSSPIGKQYPVANIQ